MDRKLAKDIVNRILKVSQVERIILFGSYAKGKQKKSSDIDILIIQPSNLPRYKRSHKIRIALRGLFPSKDIIVYTPEEVDDWKSASTSFIAKVLREGVVLYENE